MNFFIKFLVLTFLLIGITTAATAQRENGLQWNQVCVDSAGTLTTINHVFWYQLGRDTPIEVGYFDADGNEYTLPVGATVKVGTCANQDGYTPATTGQLGIVLETTTTGETIAANSYRVLIRNNGFGPTTSSPNTITVNGQSVHVGEQIEFRAFYDPAQNELQLVPAITITNTGGSEVYYQVER